MGQDRLQAMKYRRSLSAVVMGALVSGSFAQTSPRPISCVSYTNAGAAQASGASESVDSILTEFNIHPIVSGQGLRIAVTGWGKGDITWNPYPAGHKYANTDKYPGFQESRVIAGPVKTEFAVLVNGTWQKATFAGQTVGLMQPGTHMFTDWLNIPVTSGTVIRARLRYTLINPAQQLMCSTLAAYDYTSFKTSAGATTPAVDVSTFTANAFKYDDGKFLGPRVCAMPALIQTRTTDPNAHSIAAFGDSVLNAGNDSGSHYNRDGFYNPGWVGRGFARLKIPVVSFGVSGDRSEINTEATMTRRLALLRDSGADYGLITHGINDAASFASTGTGRCPASEIISRNQALAAILVKNGIKRMYLSTLHPYTISTDQWATAAGQRTKNNDFTVANWLTYNDSLRSTVPAGFYAVLDPAKYVSDSRGVWRDGTQVAQTVSQGIGNSNLLISRVVTGDEKPGYYDGFSVTGLTGGNTGSSQMTITSYPGTSSLEIVLRAMFAKPVVSGDTFRLTRVLTRDGLHPTPEGARLGAYAVYAFPNLFR